MQIDIKKRVAEINKMSNAKLKKELAQCKDSITVTIIQKIIKRRERKVFVPIVAKKKLSTDEEIDKLINSMKGINLNSDIEFSSDREDVDCLSDIREDDLDELLRDVDINPHVSQTEDFQKKFQNKKFKMEVERDHVNNQLMDRMSSDIYIRNLKANSNKKKIFVSPFSDAPDSKYASYNK